MRPSRRSLQQAHARIKSVSEFRDVFLGRLRSMARAHSMLLDADWRGTELGALIRDMLQAYWANNAEAVQVEGPSVLLTPQQSLALSLARHELGTNAAKYGALSREEGRLRLSWGKETQGQNAYLRLCWQEWGGPPVTSPTDRGFGSRLIEQACGGDSALRGQCVLVVEDEMLLAMDLEGVLQERGYRVLGPAATVGQALGLIGQERPDAALLDLNLNGQSALPIAALLNDHAVPFLVVSGGKRPIRVDADTVFGATRRLVDAGQTLLRRGKGKPPSHRSGNGRFLAANVEPRTGL